VTYHKTKKAARPFVLAGLVAMSLSLAGCGPEGAGSVKIENPQAIREKAGGGGQNPKKPTTAKQAKVQAIVDEAVKKHPKLQ
jgi:hypothetical protein